jgi:chemotaxis signal transduction protein
MVSLLTAFRSRKDEPPADNASEQLALDNDELSRIRTEVDAINADLRRVVWNGRLVAGATGGAQARLKAVLQQINEAGTRTRDRVGIAIRDLYVSSLGRTVHQAHDLARLAADIMDRNLYERANDCRWWALSPVLQASLARPADTPGGQRLNALLATINGLYTVYTRLLVFDASGAIRGVSNDDADHPLQGSALPPDLLEATLKLSDSQRYAVSPFGLTPLSGGLPTYVYLAAVRPPQGGNPVGGIAIVFNAEREFRAMLQDVLDGRHGIAAFVDAEGRVVSSTEPSHAIGEPLPFSSAAGIIELADANYAVSSAPAAGYREFKSSDGYRNGVVAVVALRLGALERRRMALFDRSLRALPSGPHPLRRELALFQVGSSRYGLPTHAVLEAKPDQGMVRVAKAGAHIVGLLEVAGAEGGCMVPVLCARRLFGIQYPARVTDGTMLVFVDPDRPGHPLFAFRVDDVLSVVDVDERHIQAAPGALRAHAPWIEAMVRLSTVGASPEEVLVQLLNPEAIASFVRPAASPASPVGAAAAPPARKGASPTGISAH